MRLSTVVTLAALFATTLLAGASNDHPVVGVVTVPISSGGACVAMAETRGREAAAHLRALEKESGGGSCFTSFYVKWLEAAGARVAVIPYDAPESELKRLVASTNGLLFTGGEVDLFPDNHYYEAARYMFGLALEMNRQGTYYPVWGTCQGFQLMNIIVANDTSVLETGKFDSEDLSLHLDLTPKAKSSRLFASAPASVLSALATEEITSNLHVSGVDPSVFTGNERLDSFFDVLSTNVDRKGKPFVSTMEGRALPVYGVQWHPERPQFEWKPGMGINHSATAVRAMQYFSDFFVNEARRNTNAFPADREYDDLIYKHQTSDLGQSYTVYFFPPSPQ